MIPGFSALPMFIRKSGGPVATGRVKFIKYVFDASNYTLDQTDIEIYTNITGYDIGIGLGALPDSYLDYGLTFPYFAYLAFYDSGFPVEYSYSSLTLGSTTFVSPVFYPYLGYVHSTTSGVVGSFADNVWYDFSITV